MNSFVTNIDLKKKEMNKIVLDIFYKTDIWLIT